MAYGTREITPFDGEQADALLSTKVSGWRDVAVPCDMNRDEIGAFIQAKATSAGIDARLPFPFFPNRPISDLHRDVDATSVRAGSVPKLPVNETSSSESAG